ncbi:PEP-CTERM sorting domain-containing protein [Aquabacterium sp.]|uniref:PEP-CTERM sorting domain-containing protein n=1 Tax=Aquabacterium sp. TaxID=1872578 RepID=UPI0035AEE77A
MNTTLRAAAAAASLLAVVASAQATVKTYNVVETFNQVVYDTKNPTWDTIFTGSFSFDDASNSVTGLTGTLTQAMSGNTTARLLTYQLSSVYDASLGGLVVTTFFQNSTDVFVGGGFAVGGKSTFGNQNAYATIFVNTTDPTAALSDAQIDKLAYADCTTGGLMMSSVCMTGWVNRSAANLAGGTMKGTYPITQIITEAPAVPEPSGYALALAGLAVVGSMARRSRRGA